MEDRYPEFKDENGNSYPSVTDIIRGAGIMSGVEYATEEDRERGRMVHKMLALMNEGTLDEDVLDPDLQGYRSAYRQFLADTGFKPLSWEVRGLNKSLRFCGTYDVVGLWNGRTCVIDFKSGVGRSLPKWVGYQLAGYDLLLPDPHSRRARFALKLCPDGRYQTAPCLDQDDYTLFMAMLSLEHLRRKLKIGGNAHGDHDDKIA